MTVKDSGSGEPIAIVGIGCHMPGGVRDIPALWEFLREQKDVHREFEEPRFPAKGFYHPNRERPGTAVASGGFVLDEDPRLFDPAFFGITDLEAETMDASQRKLLEVTYEAFENAGDTWETVSGSRMGVFVGDLNLDNYVSQTRDWDYGGKYSATGAFPNMLANRIHYVFNLKGPSLLVNSACTSAMYALHLAVTAIRNGDCDSAIVAGCNWIMDPNIHLSMSKLGALSASSRSHAFDASADGYARGEGFAALYLKPVSRAVLDKSPVRGVIMGTAVNANGRTNGVTNPSGPAQEIVIRAAYKNAGDLDPSETMLLECHGTGTRVGDPTEVKAAGNVFGPGRSSNYADRLMVGSVKTNVGHLEGACALPGILKVVAALENGEIPPTLHIKTPNPLIDFDTAKARVVTDVEPWPQAKVKRASVTSAGFGGTNGHCVIDHVNNVLPNYIKPGVIKQHINEAKGTNGTNGAHGANGINGTNGLNELNGVNGSNGTNGHGMNGNVFAVETPHYCPVVDEPTLIRKSDAATRQLVVLPFSAHNPASLKANLQALSNVVHQHSLADVAYTLSNKRSRFTHRAFAIVDRDQVAQKGLSLNEEPRIFSSPQHVRTAFVFTGQGAQWHGMGAQLFEYAVFRKSISYLDYVLSLLPTPPEWKIADILSGSELYDHRFIQTPAVSQTVCSGLQIGLVDLLASWSVRPAGVVGHSSGEMAAAYAAGRLTAAEAITAAYYRGYAVSSNKAKGAMIAVGLGHEKGQEYITSAGLDGQVKVAAINSPDSITMSGDVEAIEKLASELTTEGIFNRLLKTGGLAYHSHHMLALGDYYAQLLDDGFMSLKELISTAGKYHQIPWVSSVTPNKKMPGDHVAGSYWRANLESPVCFSEAASKLLDTADLNIGSVIEIGPHTALKNPLGQIIKALNKNIPYVASVKRGEDAHRSMVELAGTLFSINADVNLAAVNSVDEDGALAHGCMAIDLPPYKYTYGPINYLESRLSKEYRLRKVPRHDLLGSKVAGTTRLRPQWRNFLRIKDLPWLDDHRVPPHVLHPGAAHVVMAMVAAEHSYLEFPDALPIVGFTLRNLSIKKTLVVPQDDYGVEIVMSMELDDSATAKTPGWSSFSVSSVVRDTDQWTEHCSGLVKVEVASFELPTLVDSTNMDGRAVNAQSWYTRFSNMGLHFGPSFQGYSDIRADPAINVASAKLALNTTAGLFPGGESSYPIHPASFDLLVRLGLMACNGGQADTLSVQLPIHLDEMRFKHGFLDGRDWVRGISRAEKRGLRSAYGDLQMMDESGNVFLSVQNMKFTNLNNDFGDAALSAKAYSSPFTRLTWRPDIRAMSKGQRLVLLPPTPEEVTKPFPQLSKIFSLIGHANPNIRVLQLNSGSDIGASSAVLKTLTGPNGIKAYQKYAITDPSPVEFTSLRELTSEYQDINYFALDIQKDPLQQGAQQGAYDVILWLNAVDASESSYEALEHCKALLKPGGTLVLVDISGADSDAKSWNQALEQTGFEAGTELAETFSLDTNHHGTVILTTAIDKDKEVNKGSPVVHLLHGANGAPTLLAHLAQALEKRGLSTKTFPLDEARETVAPNSRVVAFLEGENLLLDADQNRISLFQHLAANTATMVWVTSCGLPKAVNPDGAFITGLLRTLGTENPSAQFLSVDLDANNFEVGDDEVHELVRCIIDEEAALQGLGDSVECEVNRDCAWQNGCLWVSRVVPDEALQEYAEPTFTPSDKDMELKVMDSQGPVRAVFGTPGILVRTHDPQGTTFPWPPSLREQLLTASHVKTSLYFRTYTELWKPLPKDWIEIKVEAVGLNWKDLGLCSGRFDQNNLSNEYVGIVTQKGPNVAHVAVGDRVYGMGKGHFGNYTRVPAIIAQKLGPEIDPIEAATMPLVYMTAVYALEHVTRVKRGQRVLIQSGSGGLGIAAIQLARSKGADVFATVGTADKARFLAEELGVPSSRIFSSRDIADLPRMVTATNNNGFDVILSTSQGDLLFESIRALAPMGTLVDVGRLDVTNSKTIALELFQKSAGFVSFDLSIVVDRNPALGGELMRAVDDYRRAGHIHPIKPYTVMDISQLDQALLRFSKGTHIGKMVISYQRPDSMVKVQQSVPAAKFDPQSRYVLVGGLTGLGRAIVRWMSDRGARDLMIWSRSGAKNLSAESIALIDGLAAKGAMKEANDGREVRGVFNFAVAYHDISFDKMTAEQFHAGMAAKVIGNKHLHEATASLPLDFFVMISTFGTFFAFPTQSTYLAANNYMDYFARYRHRLGLPATTVAIGLISDVGPLTQGTITSNLFVRAKGQTVTAAQLLRLLEPAFESKRARDRSQNHWLGYSEDPLSEANIFTCVDPAVGAKIKLDEVQAKKASATDVPRWHRDPRVSMMMRATDDAYRYQSGEGGARGAQGHDDASDMSPAAQLRRQFDLAISKIRLNAADGGDSKELHTELVELVTQGIKASVAEMLFLDPSAVNAASGVAEQGIDSLLAAEFRNWLTVAFAKNISMLDLMDARNTINALALDIVDNAVAR
ncbi:hypothetical protein JX266_001346 [Neoarthrinium moseri]|nr:hypothetical protein JX266_001346 [Neoarthrinium moseri]